MENQFMPYKERFIEDVTKLIDDMERDLMGLEKDAENSKLIESVFRHMHTLKGTSSMYGFDNVSNFTHRIESLYEFLREDKLDVTPDVIQISFLAADFIRKLIKDDDKVSAKNEQICNAIIQSVNQLIQQAGLTIENQTVRIKARYAASQNATWQINFAPDESIIGRNINLISSFKDLFALGDYHINKNEFSESDSQYFILLFTDKQYEAIEDALFFLLDYCKITKIADFDIFNSQALEAHELALKKTEPATYVKTNELNKLGELTDQIAGLSNPVEYSNAGTNGRIGVEAAKLDELMYLVSELITTNSQLALSTKNKLYNPIRPLLEKVDKLSKLFRNNTLNLRLVPLNEMVLRFQRLVRDLSQQLGKQVEMITQGTETELDKSTIDALAEPLMHIIRNCIDHGIEIPEARVASGKGVKGVIKITAFHSGNFVFIQIQDDGNGINPEVIRLKAVEKGIIPADKPISQKEAFELIFLPGFSTAESLTQVSGRGVGMDIVKKKINELRAQIEINSEIGLGTLFTIKLHQTIAILDTMLFQNDDLFFLVPVSEVEVCLITDYNSFEEYKYKGAVPYNGQLISYIDLYEVFGLNKIKTRKVKIIVIRRQEQLFAVVADKIIGEHQAVLKSLGSKLKNQEFIAGASILGDGNLAYLLDLTSMMQSLLITEKKY